MNRKTERALRGSIRKWQGVVDGTVLEQGTDNCPLCKLFYNMGCFGCPVAEDTGEGYCSGTPYEAWMLAGWGSVDDTRVINDDQFVAACFELEYLKSLLPKRKRK